MSRQSYVAASLARLKGGGLGERTKGALWAAAIGGVVKGAATGLMKGGVIGAGLGALTGVLAGGGNSFFVHSTVGNAAATKDGEDWASGKASRHISDADAMRGFQAEAMRLLDRRVGPVLSITTAKRTYDPGKWLAHRIPSWLGASTPTQSDAAKNAAEELRNGYDRMPAADREKWIKGVISGLDDAVTSTATATATAAAVAGVSASAKPGGVTSAPSGASGSMLMDLIARISAIVEELNSDISLIWRIRDNLDRIGKEFEATLDGSHAGEEILGRFAVGHDAVEQAHSSVLKAYSACTMYTERLKSM